MRAWLISLAVLVACTAGFGQNLLTNPSFQDPAFARLEFVADVADGDLVELDVTGIHRIYEFDTNSASENGGDVLVDVSGGTDPDSAVIALVAAINADPLCPATASGRQLNDPGNDPDVDLLWKGAGGDGAVNSVSTGSVIETDFNEKCFQNLHVILGWEGTNDRRNGDVFIPGNAHPEDYCPDGQHASLQGSGGEQIIYQTVSGLNETSDYLLTGVWTIGDFGPGDATYSAELWHDWGGSPISLGLARVVITDGLKYNWLPFAVAGSPYGTEMTVVLRVHDAGGNNFAMHLNDLSLEEISCTPPRITDFTPNLLFKDTIYDDGVTINGSGFVPGQTTVRIEGDDVDDIVATDVQVAPDGNSLTCDLDVPATSANGYRSVVVEVAGCGGNALVDATYILASGPFRNGSFESANPGYNACPVQPQPAPTFWDATESNNYGGVTKLFRDDLPGGAPFLPSCPPPDGFHYAATMSNNEGGTNAQNFIFQTFNVTEETEYTFSGNFAGGGNNVVEMEMRDGTGGGPLLASATVHPGGGSYDWTFNAISAVTPAGSERMTVGWRVRPVGPAPHASYADHLQVQVCSIPVSVTGVTPDNAVGDGLVAVVVEGTGFSGSPQVLLTKLGLVINASSVNVVSGTLLECEFDLTGAGSGNYDMLVVQDGCIGKLSDVPADFSIVATGLINGSFEDPTASQNCGGDTFGTPTGWSATDGFRRDGSVHVPTCPPVDGIHYGSLHIGATFPQRAWQTISVNSGWTYRFGGDFAGGGPNAVRLRLLDGDINGTPIAVNEFYNSSAVEPPDGYPWTQYGVEGTAVSAVMTVVWEMSGSGASAAHADNLSFTVVNACNDPFADTDNDGDVDLEDAALLQLCFTGSTGTIPSDPAYCVCLNRNPQVDQVIDQIDVADFDACASGPNIPADPGCDD